MTEKVLPFTDEVIVTGKLSNMISLKQKEEKDWNSLILNKPTLHAIDATCTSLSSAGSSSSLNTLSIF